MDFNFVKKLVQLIDTSTITDLEIEEDNTKIKISKKGASVQAVQTVQIPQQVYQTPEKPQAANAAGSSDSTDSALTENLHEVRSPIVGTFYRASSPEAENFVQAGDQVTAGATLCIIEAMKLMNEIESDVDGKIVKILVENGKPVEYNQPLFLIKVG